MGFEGDLVSKIPMAEDEPLSALTGDENLAGASDDTDVPVAEFQSSV